MKLKEGVLCAFLIASSVEFSSGAEIFVAPDGSDANDGTKASPLATITAARDKADQLKTGGPVTVFLRGGTYYLKSPVEFKSANSGTAAAPITYTAYGTEKPVISGGIKLANLTWTVSNGSIMKTTIAKDLKADQLFVNGKRQIMARYPNYNDNQFLQGSAADALTKAAACADPAEGPGYIRALHGDLWGGNDYIITGKNGNTVSYTWVGDNQRGNTPHAQYRMVENIFELLDQAGEWFYRKSTGELFFWPPSGTDLSTSVIEMASMDELFHIAGASMTDKISYISFKGLTFTQTYRTMFNTAIKYEPLFMGDWCIMKTGTVFIQNAENIRVESCNFDQVGGNALFINGYNRKHVVFNNIFEGGGASCVVMCGLPSSVRCPCNWSSSLSCNDNTAGPASEEYPAYILVDNNTMHNFGQFEKQVAGIEYSATKCDTIRHNTISHCPRAGINANDGAWGGHLIEFNKVFDVVRETSDHGPFNSWGRNRNWGCGTNQWNLVPTLEASRLDPQTPTIIRYNYFRNTDTNMFGIDLDDGSTNYYCYSNLCIGGGFKLQRGRFNHFINNVVVGGGTYDIHDPMPQNGDSIKHNIIVGREFADWCCSWAGLSANGQGLSEGVVSRGSMIDSNCYWGYGTKPRIYSWVGWGSGASRTGTACTWDQWIAGGNDKSSKIADPLFVDPSKEDYRVKDGSPALALGFKNFPMDSFGVRPVSTVAVNGTRNLLNVNRGVSVQLIGKRLLVFYKGNYSLTITTVSGRVVQRFTGKDSMYFNLNHGSGMYLVNIMTSEGGLSQKTFIY
jgi:hypothetical protein